MSITERLYWEHLGLAAALAISLFVLMGLLLRLRETTGPRMHIWAMIGFFSVNALDLIESFAFSSVFNGPAWLYRWQDVLVPGFMVSLYFYVRALTSSNPQVGRRDLVHVLPFLCGFLCLSPNLLRSGDVRSGLVDGVISDSRQELVDLGENAFWILWILVLCVYGGLCIRRLAAHKRNIRDVFSDLEGKSLRWLDGLVLTIFALAFFVIVDEVRLLMGLASFRDGLVSLLYDVTLAGAFGVFALRAVPPLPQWSADVITQAPPPLELEAAERGEQSDRRYARSGLLAQDLDRYATRLERRMADGKLWREHALNLRGLASEIAIPPIHLSEVLNTKLGMSFYDYVNQCRIRDACDLLIRTDETVLEISETVGFNAKSTFNTSFKKVTDQTPTQWRRTHRP